MSDQLPAELARALEGDAAARQAFDALPPSHKHEYVEWVGEAKRDETRERRAAKAVEMIRAAAASGQG